VQREIRGPEEQEWKKVQNEEFHNAYPSHNIVRVIEEDKNGYGGSILALTS
jgi:hypothetical protein